MAYHTNSFPGIPFQSSLNIGNSINECTGLPALLSEIKLAPDERSYMLSYGIGGYTNKLVSDIRTDFELYNLKKHIADVTYLDYILSDIAKNGLVYEYLNIIKERALQSRDSEYEYRRLKKEVISLRRSSVDVQTKISKTLSGVTNIAGLAKVILELIKLAGS